MRSFCARWLGRLLGERVEVICNHRTITFASSHLNASSGHLFLPILRQRTGISVVAVREIRVNFTTDPKIRKLP